MPLSELAIRHARPGLRPRKLFDAAGLYLLITPKGSRWWRLKYRFRGVEKLLSLGTYPEVSLKRARERCQEARRLLAEGIDPSTKRQVEKASMADTFEAIAREWLALQQKPSRNGRALLAPATFEKKQGWLEDFVFPHLGSHPIGSIRPPELLLVLKKIEARGIHETAHRVRSMCGNVFRYAIATGRAERDITADLRGALAPVIVKNRAAIVDPARIGELLRAIDGYRGHYPTEIALKLAPLVFVRPGELRWAEWSEFDLAAAEWHIPAARMKMGEKHVVPLARQAVALLRDLEPHTGEEDFVFLSPYHPNRPICENTINAALRRMGFAGNELTAHGFRAMASTCLNELGWHPDLIELQLAHAERDEVRGAYNRAQRLAERRTMMQAWADYLDGLRGGINTRTAQSANSSSGHSLHRVQ